jgi:hypothetical protein
VLEYVHKTAMGMVCATAEDIATVLWGLPLLSVTTLVLVAVRTVAQPLILMVSFVLKTKTSYKMKCCLEYRFQ